MDTIEAIHTRRSVRAYRPEPVPRPLIEDLIWAAAQAPTPPVSGDVPWAFCVVEGVERLAGYGQRALQHAREHPGEGSRDGSRDGPRDGSRDGSRETWPDRPGFKVFWDAPALVLICGRQGNPEARLDCCRAGQNLLLAAHARGLGSCWVGAPLPWLHSAGVAEELGLPPGFKPVVAVVLGLALEAPTGNPRPRPPVCWC